MSSIDKQPTASINLTVKTDSNFDSQSSLTSTLLKDYEVVPNPSPSHVVTNDSENQISGDHIFADSVSYTVSSSGTIHLEEDVSSARKLRNICSEFQEAAIYLLEGVENEKLWHHPTDAKSYWAYKVIHNPVYYVTEFLTCLLLMLLAFLERPTFINVPIQVAPCIELLCLFYISIDVVLKLLWIKPKFAIKHRRTVFKCILLVVMFGEAITVLSRYDNHFRVTRALRPLFLVDTILLQDVRRILRQIFQCLGRIIDVLILLFFFVTIFAVSGFYLFATSSPTNFQFRSFRESFISLYILTTTANFPDVMMESYKRSRLTPIFFIIFLVIGLYMVSNVLLAVVFSTFQKIQKEKFRKLFLHRRDAIRHAFSVLAVKGPKHRMLSLQNYLLLMECYSPFTSKLTSMLTFKAMLKDERMVDEEAALRLDEFQNFYDIQGLSWHRVTGYGEKIRWYRYKNIPDSFYLVLKHLTQVVESLIFKVTMNLIVLSNALFFFIVTSHVEDPDQRFHKSGDTLTINFIYGGIYLLETILKLIALGPIYYFRSYWNVFDFVIITSTFVIELFEIGNEELIFVIPLRFLRLIRFNKRFRAIFNTLALVLPRIISIIVLLMLIYYFFAIIGMEAFSGEVFQDCCNENNNDIGAYYTGNGSNVYYLNNFDSISQSFVTLFELMVINNWWIIMEGFRNAIGDKPSRPFFICFHLTTAVVLTVAIAFIVEAFVHKFQFTQFTNVKDELNVDGKFLIRSEVEVKKDEIQTIEKNFKRAYWPWELPESFRKQMTAAVSLTFEGTKRRTKEDLHKLLFEDCIEEWIEEDNRFQKSRNYVYNQKPETSNSIALIERLKNVILYSLLYIFE